MITSDKDITQIDIVKSIKESDSGVLKKIPGFVLNWIVKLANQDEMNRILAKYYDSFGAEFLVKIIEEFNITLDITGKENIPENGKCFFVANHPFGIIDGLIITLIVSKKYSNLKAIGNDAFAFLPQLRPLIFAVNVYGSSSKEIVKALDELYHSDIAITHFPAGEVSRLYKGKVQDSAWQKSVITKAISCQRNVIPIHFSGRNSRLFYMLNILRRMIGVKLNIEMLLLPREMFRKRNKTIKVNIGKCISYKTFEGEGSHWDLAQKLRSQVYELGNKKVNY